MINKALPALALAFSLGALVISTTRNNKTQPAESQPTPIKTNDLEKRVQHLEKKLEALADENQRLLLANSSAEPAEMSPDGVADIERRQNKLEQNLTQLGVFEHFEALKKKADESYAAALDDNLSAKERLDALSDLRRSNRIDEAVVKSMVNLWSELGNEKGDAYARWTILDNMEGITDTALRNEILYRLPEESSPKLRARAIETMGPMLPDPYVEEWLLYLSENDEAPAVRQQAVDTYNRFMSDK